MADDAIGFVEAQLRGLDAGPGHGSEGEDLSKEAGPAEVPHTKAPFATLILHINREVMHHGAEVALLRDLYRASGAEVVRSPTSPIASQGLATGQLATKQLASGVSWQRLGVPNAGVHLVACQAGPTECAELGDRRWGVQRGHQHCTDHLPPVLVGNAIHSCLGEARVGQERCLHFGRVDVLTAGYDQVVAPIDYVEVALGVQVAEGRLRGASRHAASAAARGRFT